MTIPSNEVQDAAEANEQAGEHSDVTMPHEESPFVAGRWRVSRPVAIVGFIGAAGLAILGVYVATRGERQAGASAGHDHSATISQEAGAVMLTDEQTRRIGVTYTTTTMSRLATEVRSVAQVAYDETRVKTIAPKLDGWVELLYVNITGQVVRQGDPLLAIYSPMVVSAEEELLLATQLGRDMATASPDARRGSADLADASRRRLLYWDIPSAEINRIEKTGEIQKTVVLRSPVSGVVVEKAVLSGQKVMAGDALFKVADLRVVWLEGEVFERDLAAVRLGQVVRAEFQALPGASRMGRITYIYATVDPDTRTARVRVELANRDLALKPGMYATIRIQGATAAATLNVPRSAVLATGERNLVFVRRADGMLEPRDVTVGIATDDRIQILTGLRAGETVVQSATFLIDAESNLGSALGGMGNMPGMDLTAPRTPPSPKHE